MKQLVHIVANSYLMIMLLSACTYDVVPEPQNCDAPPRPQLVSATEASCGLASGAVQVQADGGIAPYTFRINEEREQATGNFSELSAGSHIVTINDSKGCEGSLVVQVANQDGVNTTVATVDAACDSANGRIEVMAEGGVPPYQFRINEQTFQNASSFANLAPGEYQVITRDATACESVQTVQLSSGVKFAAVESIMKTNCAISNCHDGTIVPDFRSAATIQQRATRIEARTASKTMPPASSGRELTDQQIQDIACWVGDGANIRSSL
jgi:hypothetical protein